MNDHRARQLIQAILENTRIQIFRLQMELDARPRQQLVIETAAAEERNFVAMKLLGEEEP
jgi:hypothetical protein